MSLIALTGIPDNYPLPGTLVQINFAAGPASQASTIRSAILLGNKLSTGSADVDGYLYGPTTAVPLQSEFDAISLFGAGSELHRMYRQFIARNPVTQLFAAPIKESTGSQAALSLTLSGTPSAAGTIRVFTPEGPIDTGFASTDSLSDICDNVVANLNGNVNLPFTAAAASPSVVLTAKQKGLRGNWLRAGVLVIGSGTGVSVTNPATGFMSFFSGGTAADSNSEVISFLEGLGVRFYYQVSAAEDSTQFPALADAIAAQAAPAIGIRQRCFCGSVDSAANTITVSTAANNPRAEIIALQDADIPPSELASVATAVYSLEENSLGAQWTINFNGYGGDANTSAFWNVPAPLNGSAFSKTVQVSLLNSGVTPIQVLAGGNTSLVRRITSYFLDGSVNDYRVRDSSQVTICDFFADDLSTQATLQFAGKIIGNDPTQGQPLPGPTVVTPRVFRSLINNLLSQYFNSQLIQNLSDIMAATVVIRETNPSTRLSCEIPLQPAQILNQIGVVVDQIFV